MKSNYAIAQVLEEKLLEHNTNIYELRNFITGEGLDLTIQPDNLWLSRPGLDQAVILDMPSSDLDWRSGEIYLTIKDIANLLWAKEDIWPEINDHISGRPAIIL